MISVRMLPALLAGLLSFADAAPKPLQTIEGCRLLEGKWNDGDSFRIETPDKREFHVRLYLADCLELHVESNSDTKRLRDQRRYFGITRAKDTTQASIELANTLAKEAADLTTGKLEMPFTVQTRFHKAPVRGGLERYYAFVTTAAGEDLASELIRAGLARATSRSMETAAGMSAERYRGQLGDYEIQAAKRGEGIWQYTDWEELPKERDAQRVEDEEDLAAANQGLPADFRLNPNTADREELDLLPGIGERLADAIIEAREELQFEEAKDLMRVPSIKQKTLAKFERYLEFKVP